MNLTLKLQCVILDTYKRKGIQMINLTSAGTQATIEHYQNLIQAKQQELDLLVRSLEQWLEYSESAEETQNP